MCSQFSVVGHDSSYETQYLIVDYAEILIFNHVVFVLANTDVMSESEDSIKDSLKSMMFSLIYILNEENEEVQQCDVPEIRLHSLAIEDQTYSVSCAGKLGRKVKFETVSSGKSILIIETWAQTSTPPPPPPVGRLNHPSRSG